MLNEVVVECVKEEVSVDCKSDKIDENEQCDQSVQCDFDKSSRSSIEKVQNNPEMVKYYTGFEHYDHSMMFFFFKFLVFKCNLLSPQDQLFFIFFYFYEMEASKR